MRTTIYYFSATGNSLKVALDLADKLGNTKVLSISDTQSTDPDLSSDRIGFVFPVHIWGVPLIVDRFLEKINMEDQDKYIFAIATCKSSPGAVLHQFQKKLKRRKLTLSAGYAVYMPGNNIIYYRTDSDDVKHAKFSTWNKQLDAITLNIQTRSTFRIKNKSLIKRFLLTKILHNIITGSFNNADRHFWSDTSCTGCSTCAEVCPVNNIVISSNTLVWLHKCEQCTACINLCPRQAIQYTRSTIGRKRYKNPFVKLDYLKKNN